MQSLIVIDKDLSAKVETLNLQSFAKPLQYRYSTATVNLQISTSSIFSNKSSIEIERLCYHVNTSDMMIPRVFLVKGLKNSKRRVIRKLKDGGRIERKLS